MRRFLVLQTVTFSDEIDGDSSLEPIMDFDTYEDAEYFINEFENPEDFEIEDTEVSDEEEYDLLDADYNEQCSDNVLADDEFHG